MLHKIVTVRVVALCLVGLMGPVLDAKAQTEGLPRGEQQHARRVRLTLPVLPPLDAPLFWQTSVLTRLQAGSSPQLAAPQTCRRGRRAWIGALIGAGAAPLAVFVHKRWENEGGNGAAAAATTVALAGGAGALIGSMTCQ